MLLLGDFQLLLPVPVSARPMSPLAKILSHGPQFCRSRSQKAPRRQNSNRRAVALAGTVVREPLLPNSLLIVYLLHTPGCEEAGKTLI